MRVETLILNHDEVGSLCNYKDILENVECGFINLSEGYVTQPPIMNLVEPGTHTGFDIKSCLDLKAGYYSVKSSSGSYPDNEKLGLPSGLNTVYLYDAQTSALRCVMEANYIRDLRTGAAAAIAVKYLSRKNASVYFAYGAGRIAKACLRMTMLVRKIKDVYVFGYLPGETDAFIEEMSKEFPDINYHTVSIPEEGAKQADIIVTATLARKGPVIQKEWLKPGTHISAMGADGPSKQELYADIFQGAKITCDFIEYSSSNGELYHAIQEGYVDETDVYSQIGDIISGKKAGRTDEQEITIYDSVGTAVQDLSMALSIYRRALSAGIGIKAVLY